jgi:transcriptional regulator with XRE-family HTH domain
MLDELLSQWEAADSELALSNSPLAPSAERLAPTTVVDRLGRRLQAIRQRQQLTLDLLARRSGVPAEILGDIERGVRAASVDILADVARALGMTLSELFVDVDRPLPHDANRLGAALAGRSPKAQQALLTLLNTLLPLVP